MAALSKAPALSPLHRYLIAVLVGFRRFINRSVANILAKREQEAARFMLKTRSDRKPKLSGLIVAGSLSPVMAKAEEPVVRDQRQEQPEVCDHRKDGAGRGVSFREGAGKRKAVIGWAASAT